MPSVNAMEPPSPFDFPARRPSPLHPLSPERVNRRPASTATLGSRRTTETESCDDQGRETSPERKANLFADYHPVMRTPSPSKEIFGGGVAQSPSLPDITSLRSHGRTNSDVQGLVKRFEHLDVRDRDAESEARRRKQEMELRRAQLGREEAESELQKWREECRRIAEDLKESRHRESKVSNRLEKVMDDFRQAKGEYSSNAEAYVKEVRKARKEAFKSSSAMLKLQETLRDTQKRLQVSKIDHATDVQKADRFEQEATDSKCALIALQQDLSKLQEQFKVLEQEKEALKTNLKEEEVARIAAEGQIALPSAQEDDESLIDSPRKTSSPRKLHRSPLSDDKENVGIITKKMIDSRRLQEDLDAEKLKREAAEDMVEFLRMECAFKCCDCTSATKHGRAFEVSMDEILASSIEKMKADIASILTPPASDNGNDDMDVEEHISEPTSAAAVPTDDVAQMQQELADEVMNDDAHNVPLLEGDHSMTMVADDTPVSLEDEVLQAPHPTPAHAEGLDEQGANQQGIEATEDVGSTQEEPTLKASQSTFTVPLKDSPPSTPNRAEQEHDFDMQHPHSIRTITTTTRIPMHFTPVSKPALLPAWEQENHPPSGTGGSGDCAVNDGASNLPFDREAALAAIAYRRGRAKSMANGTLTPRKQMVEGINLKGRRDISAPVIGAKGYSQRANSVGRSAGKVLRA